MIGKKLEEALNEQINAELYSSYLYYSMSAYFESVGHRGFASWMRVQAMEEMFHADKFFKFVHDRGGRVLLKAIQAPKTEWNSVLAVIEDTLVHERHVTSRIHNLVDLALQEKDFATKSFLDWFVNEQVEEEANVEEIIQDLRMVGDSREGIFLMNRELGQRTFQMPAAPAAE